MFLSRAILRLNKPPHYLNILSLSRHLPFNRLCSSKPLLDITDSAVLQYLEDTKKEYWDLKTNRSQSREIGNKLRELLPVVKLLEERTCIIENLKNLEDIDKEGSEKDKEMLDLVKEEKEIYEGLLKDINTKITESLFIDDVKYGISDTILEISAGVGGQEAMLFAKELFDMYLGYADFKKWTSQVTHIDKTGIGGVKKVSAVITGSGSYELLRTEGGVHRVQRTPATEKAGRLHTSTVTVAVLLQPTEIELNIPDRDLKMETKRSTGAGGQHVNTTDSCVRITHIPTGITVECQTERNQIQNKKNALERLRAILYQQQEDKQEMEEKMSRKSQVGLGLRNEKIRTYNYPQDRVTDHRIGASNGTVHGIENLLSGGENLEKLISRLRRHIKTQNVLEKIEYLRKNSKSATNS